MQSVEENSHKNLFWRGMLQECIIRNGVTNVKSAEKCFHKKHIYWYMEGYMLKHYMKILRVISVTNVVKDSQKRNIWISMLWQCIQIKEKEITFVKNVGRVLHKSKLKGIILGQCMIR